LTFASFEAHGYGLPISHYSERVDPQWRTFVSGSVDFTPAQPSEVLITRLEILSVRSPL
jgi:hypothetical protein